MGSREKRKHPLYRSFGYAGRGIYQAFRTERNLRIHFAAAAAVIICGFYFGLETVEWLFVILAIAGMLTLELINSAIERVVDLVTKEYHPLAGEAKDFAAGAVLVYAVFSVIIGLLIFIPKL